jgi:hypothetical protein
MAVYRFRVFIEDDHDVYRDIEIQGRQRFADLHSQIVQSFNFQRKQAAEYANSDQQWHEGETVVELDSELEGDHQKIVSHINFPRQRFLCITMSYKEVGLALELQKILKDEDGVTYPRCTKIEGAPPYYSQPPPEPIVDEPGDVEIPEMDPDMFTGDGPSEAEIERIQKEAEVASKAGKLKAPQVDFKKLKKKSTKKEEGFDDFNMDDLM